MIKKILPILIILSLVLPSVVQVAQAGVLDSTVGFSSCATAGFLTNKITTGLSGLLRNLTQLPTNVVPVIDRKFIDTYQSKESIEDIIARCAAREVLTAMGRNITNVARTGGRDGGPAWVRNWRNFRLDSQYRGEGIFKAMLASTNTCEYFANDLKGLFGANQKTSLTKIKTRVSDVDSYQVRAGCTLPGDFKFEQYKKDFSGNGGWEAWSRLLQPQNNFYGSLFQAQDEMNRQRASGSDLI